jgi:hypothetical protein
VRRNLFNFAAALSLLLCVATVVLWVRSYHTWDSSHWNGPDRSKKTDRYAVGIADGEVSFVHVTTDTVPLLIPPGFRSVAAGPRGPRPPPTWTFVGITYLNIPTNFSHLAEVNVPLWMPVLALSVLPFVRVLQGFRRVRSGCCLTCGYSLTGNTSGVCPECGTPVPQKAGATV